MHELVGRLGRARAAVRDPRSTPNGQVLVLFALSLVVFLGAAALVVDYGTWLVARRNYQNVADQAALAGVHYLVPPDNVTCADNKECARAEAWNYLNTQLRLGLDASDIATSTYAGSNTAVAGVTAGAYTIWVDTPPGAAGAAYPGNQGTNPRTLFVKVEANQQPYFARVFGSTGVPVAAWATAGTFPNRWAVLTLRRGKNGVDIDSGPSNTKDIALKGTNSELDVVNGDVGGNYGMQLSASSTLKLIPGSGGQANLWLIDYTSCGNSCWMNPQVQDGSGNSMSLTVPPNGANRLPLFIADPRYPAPPELNTSAPSGPAGSGIPKAAGTDNNGDVTIKNGDPGMIDPVTGKCPADTPVLGPGWVRNINVAGGQCLILAGNVQRTDIFDPTKQTYIPASQRPGVFYVTGSVNINGGTVPGLVIGDGVTVFFRGDASFVTSSGAAMDLNRGWATTNTSFTTGVPTNVAKYGAWTTKGGSSWKWSSSFAHYVYRSAYSPGDPTSFSTADGRGLAVYVLKPSQYGASLGSGTTVINSSSGSTLAWSGVTYAPNDNVSVAGQPNHNGFGQLISWTFTFNGGSQVTQTYDGPDEAFPVLIEPCTNGSDGACQ